MSLLSDSPNAAPHPRPRRLLPSVAWLASGVLLAWWVLANPLGLAVLDGFRHRLLGDHPVTVKSTAGPEGTTQLWTCGMHPQVVQDHPGTCPICGMNLVPMQADEEPAGGSAGADAAGSGQRRILLYRNPMDPTVTSPVPMKDEMGMDYVPVYSDQVERAAKQGASVTIDPAIVQNMNVLTRTVTRGTLTREIQTVGYLDYDQKRMVAVTTKYPGFVEKVYVNYVGELVEAGQPLFEIYAPELVQTEQDLLSALEFAKRMAEAPDEARRRAEDLVAAARSRLSYWDITAAQVQQLESGGRVLRTLTVVAPVGGVVMMRMPGLEGTNAKPGMELFHIADLSSLWLSVEAFEDQVGWLRVGSTAQVSLSYLAGETFTGRIRYIEPQVNEKTRTVQLKLELPNRGGRLRAGMYATVRFQPVVVRDAVLIPSFAVLRTGQRNLVIVAEDGGRFTPREVQLGSEGEGQAEILSGLQEGERVVTSSQFLIDSESNLREAVQKLLAGRAAAPPPPTHQH